MNVLLESKGGLPHSVILGQRLRPEWAGLLRHDIHGPGLREMRLGLPSPGVCSKVKESGNDKGDWVPRLVGCFFDDNKEACLENSEKESFHTVLLKARASYGPSQRHRECVKGDFLSQARPTIPQKECPLR